MRSDENALVLWAASPTPTFMVLVDRATDTMQRWGFEELQVLALRQGRSCTTAKQA